MRRRYVFDAQRSVSSERCECMRALVRVRVHMDARTHPHRSTINHARNVPSTAHSAITPPNTFIPIPFCGMSFACDAHRYALRARTSKRSEASERERAGVRANERVQLFCFVVFSTIRMLDQCYRMCIVQCGIKQQQPSVYQSTQTVYSLLLFFPPVFDVWIYFYTKFQIS